MADVREKFLALDALRGVGAICVVLAHIVYDEKIPFLFANASPGVDFFFVLSGFVIAHAYEQALRTTMSLRRYFRIRMIRLYPTILIGGLVGFAVAALMNKDPAYNIWAATALQVLLIPMFFGGPDIFPLNVAHWSLFFELAANFVHAALAKVVTEARLWAVLAVSFVALVFSAFHFGVLNIGWGVESFYGGFARIAFSFTLGLLLYRLHTSGRLRAPKISVVWIALALVLAMAIPAPAIPFGGAIHDLIAVCIVFPSFVVFAANANAPPQWSGALQWLGFISYPLYALHVPLLRLMGGSIVEPGVPHLVKAVGWGLVTAACVAIAWAVAALIDAPLRAWLTRLARRKEGAVNGAATEMTGPRTQ